MAERIFRADLAHSADDDYDTALAAAEADDAQRFAAFLASGDRAFEHTGGRLTVRAAVSNARFSGPAGKSGSYSDAEAAAARREGERKAASDRIKARARAAARR